MIEDLTFEGFWWAARGDELDIPADQERLVPGRLTIAEGRPELELLGTFGREVLEEAEGSVVYGFDSPPVPRVHGFTKDGKRITLDDCRSLGPSFRAPGIATDRFLALAAYIGPAWFAADEPIEFDEIWIRTATLGTWAGVSGMRRQLEVAELPESGLVALSTLRIDYTPPPEIEIPLADGAVAQLEFQFSLSGQHVVETDVTLEQRAALVLRRNTPGDLRAVATVVRDIRNLLSLAIGKSETVVAVAGFREIDKSEHGTRRPVEIYWPIKHNADPPERRQEPFEMLFTLRETSDIGATMRTWFANYPRFKPALDLYFGMLHHPDMYSDLKFLAYAQSLETYEFRRADSPYELPKNEHRKLQRAVLKWAPEEWREWLRTRLINNYRPLDERIRAALNRCPEITAKAIGSTAEEQEAFISLFKHSRNYYTHHTPELEAKAATEIELYLLSLQVRTLIEAALLRDLGFDCHTVDRLLDRGRRYEAIRLAKSQLDVREPEESDQPASGASGDG